MFSVFGRRLLSILYSIVWLLLNTIAQFVVGDIDIIRIAFIFTLSDSPILLCCKLTLVSCSRRANNPWPLILSLWHPCGGNVLLAAAHWVELSTPAIFFLFSLFWTTVWVYACERGITCECDMGLVWTMKHGWRMYSPHLCRLQWLVVDGVFLMSYHSYDSTHRLFLFSLHRFITLSSCREIIMWKHGY